MNKPLAINEMERKRDDVMEMAELLNKVPDNKKERILGIIEGVAMSVNQERKGA